MERILDSRLKNRQLQFLVRWKGYSEKHNQWLPEANLANAKDAIRTFYRAHPHAPRRIRATLFDQVDWRPLRNFTLQAVEDSFPRWGEGSTRIGAIVEDDKA